MPFLYYMKHYSTLILLGGNMPETIDLFHHTEEKIKSSFGNIINQSSIYKSTPWGFETESDFYNKVIETETFLEPEKQISVLLEIEKLLGRKRKMTSGYKSRGIDIDIQFIDDLEIETSSLIVPHPHLHNRRFALIPLNEKWGNKIHPSLKKTVNELLQICTDKGDVTLWITV